MRIGTITGSLAGNSINGVLARALEVLIRGRAEMVRIPIGALPLYDRDLEAEFPAAATEFKQQIRALDGLIVATPEYNRSMPASLKNAFEWGARPYGDNAFAGLPAGIVGASPGALGTAVAQQHVRNVMSHLDMLTLGQPEVFLCFVPEHFNADGTIADGGTREFLGHWVDRFLAHVERHSLREGQHAIVSLR